MAKKKEERPMRIPSLVATEHGYAVNKWCGSCKNKEIQSASTGTADGERHCIKLDIIVDIDDICQEWELEEKLKKL